jgi:hypothetical protein
MSFDFIGDVHGQHQKLLALLNHLGYRETGGIWRCAARTAVFVGDLIDRGPGQWDTLTLVRRMVAAGAAHCVMGNHEFNAIAWTVPDPQMPGEYLRPHAKPGNRHQHRVFLEAVEGTERHAEIIGWFKTLPLWLDLGGVRVVHACWHQPSMDRLAPLLGPGCTLTDELILMASRESHWAHCAVEALCKGPEVTLPGGMGFKDKEGKLRTEVRVRWWESDLSTYRKAAIGPPGDMDMVPDAPMPREWQTLHYEGPPVVFGHYWFSGAPQVISERFVCVDYSAAAAGPLVAYRWDGESALSSHKLAWVS